MNKKTRKLLTWCLVVCMVLTQMLFTNIAFAANTSYAGTDRYDTASQLAIGTNPNGATSVVLATGENFPDSLAASLYNQPILLTQPGALTPSTATTLTTLKVKNVTIVGGIGAVSQAVEDAVKAMGITVTRVGGADRSETALNIAKADQTAPEAVALATGVNYPDSLAFAGFSASKNIPILLLPDANTVPASVKDYIGNKKVYILGGTGVVSAAVENQFSGAVRLGGANRYATAQAINNEFAKGVTITNVVVATGENFPDALASGYLAAKAGTLMVLADANGVVDADTMAFIDANSTQDTTVTAVGGLSTVAKAKSSIESKIAAKVPSTLQINSIKAINAKQMEITFNKAVDEDTVVDEDNVVTGLLVINRLPESSTAAKNITADDMYASLSDDGTVLTLTADEDEYFDGTYAVSVVDDQILSEDRTEKISGYTTSITMDDTTAPKVNSVTYKPATSQLKITVSEPLLVKPSVRINNKAVTVSEYDPTDPCVYTVDVDPDYAGTTVDVKVAGGQDYNSNIMASYTDSLKLATEEGDVSVKSISQKNSNTVEVVFNRALKGADDDEAAGFVQDAVDNGDITVFKGSTQLEEITVTRNSDDDSSNCTFDFAIADNGGPDWFYGSDKSSATLTMYFAEGVLEDVYGNTNSDEIDKSITMSKDTAGPKVVSYKVTNDEKEIRVKFDQDLQELDADDADADAITSNIQLRKSGYDVDSEIAIDGDEVIFTTGDDTAWANGSYSVRFTKATDSLQDTSGNRVATQTYSGITVDDGDTTAASVVSVSAGAEDNQFIVVFDDSVGSSALDPASYTLDGVTLPENTDIFFSETDPEDLGYVASDKQEVTIQLQSSAINYSDDDSVLTVVGVKDADGNKVDVFASDDDLSVVDNTAATLLSAKLIGKSTLVLKFDEDLDDTVEYADLASVTNDFIIKRGTIALDGELGTATVTSAIDGDTLTLTITGADDASNWNSITAVGGTITVETNDGLEDPDVIALTDESGLAVDTGVKVTATRQN